MPEELDEALLNRCLDKVFLPADLKDSDVGDEMAAALQTLIIQYTRLTFPSVEKILHFDFLAMKLLFTRLQRDAYGLMQYAKLIDKLALDNRVDEPARQQLKRELCTVSVRINSKAPRKTRVAAAFSLWFSALKPVFLSEMKADGIPEHMLMTFAGSCNFWIACQFLGKIGKLELGEGDDRKERLDRIRYDFTVRDLNLSSLEMLYCSIYRPKAGEIHVS